MGMIKTGRPKATTSTINSTRWILKLFLFAGKNTIKNQPWVCPVCEKCNMHYTCTLQPAVSEINFTNAYG
jgi:hypothetical protein